MSAQRLSQCAIRTVFANRLLQFRRRTCRDSQGCRRLADGSQI